MGHAEAAGDVGRTGLAFAGQQIRDQLDIILKQRGRLRRPRLAEAARLGSFRGELSHGEAIPGRRQQRPCASRHHTFLTVSKCSLSYIMQPLTIEAAIAYTVTHATLWCNCCMRLGSMTTQTLTEPIGRPASLTEQTVATAHQVLAGKRGGLPRGAGLCRSGHHRLDRLYGPRQLRHQHSGRREIWLWAAVGGAARQRHRDAVPGPFGQARHRHRPQSRRTMPRSFPASGGLGDVGRQRDRRHGDRSRRVPRRRHRTVIAVSHAAPRRHDRDRESSPTVF